MLRSCWKEKKKAMPFLKKKKDQRKNVGFLVPDLCCSWCFWAMSKKGQPQPRCLQWLLPLVAFLKRTDECAIANDIGFQQQAQHLVKQLHGCLPPTTPFATTHQSPKADHVRQAVKWHHIKVPQGILPLCRRDCSAISDQIGFHI